MTTFYIYSKKNEQIKDITTLGGTMTGELLIRVTDNTALGLISKSVVSSFISSSSPKSPTSHQHNSANFGFNSNILNKLQYLKNLTGNVVDILNSKLPKSGGAVTGQITSSTTPLSSRDAVTKAYLSAKAKGSVPTGHILTMPIKTSDYFGYLRCDGSLKQKSTYPTLSSILNTTSQTNQDMFSLPNLSQMETALHGYGLYIKT